MAQSPEVKEVWTPKEEAELQRLLARKTAVMAEQRANVNQALCDLPVSGEDFELCISHLIENADKVCAALKPFTSGS